MVDIWKYANPGTHLRIITTDGQVFEGKTIIVWDAAEQIGDETEDTLDITLQDGEIMGFPRSEIAEIEVIA